MVNMSFRTEDEKKKRIAALAGKLERSQGWIINTALDCYLQHQEWIGQLIQQRLMSIKQGEAKLVSHEDALANISDATSRSK